MSKPTHVNLTRTIGDVDDLVTVTIDTFVNGLRGLAEATGDAELIAHIDKADQSERIVKTLSSIIFQVCGRDLEISFDLMNKVAESIINMGSVDNTLVKLTEDNISDFAQAIGAAVSNNSDTITFTDSSGEKVELPLDVARKALDGANEMRAQMGHAPVEPSTGTIH